MPPIHRNQHLADRRDYPRFNSAGDFWASLGRVEQVVVRNLSVTGALLDVPVALQAMRVAHIALPDEGPVVDAVVRSASPASDAPDRFVVGVEFIDLSEAARAALSRMVRAWEEDMEAARAERARMVKAWEDEPLSPRRPSSAE